MSDNLGERIASLEAANKANFESINSTLNLMREERQISLNQLRDMHKQHFAESKNHGEELVEVRGVAESAKRHIDGHIENHWKWVGTVAAIVTISVGVVTLITRIK